MSFTHPLPTYHPTTPPLRQGEVVYLISGKLDIEKVRSTFQVYSWVSPEEILHGFIISDSEAVAKRKSTGELIRISTHMMGYIISDKHISNEQAVMLGSPMSGYNIRWEYKDSNGYHNIFQDEEAIVPLKDLIILNGNELATEVNMDGRSTKGQQKR